MHKGFTKTTLSLLGAALLSSSAFAVGPSIDAIPDVFITDKTKDSLEIDSGNLSTGLTNIYRYTDAIRLSDYVDPGDATEDQLKWLFVEQEGSDFDLNGTGAAIVTPSTITINGDSGEAAAPDQATVIGSGNAIGTVGSAADDLDFRNVALTPDLNVSGTAPTGLNGVDRAVITLFGGIDDDSTNELLVSSFNVFTTNNDLVAPNDLVTDPTGSTSILQPVACYDDFAGWNLLVANQTADYTLLPGAAGFFPATSNANGTGSPTPTNSVVSDTFGPLTVDVTTSTPTLTANTDATPASLSPSSSVIGLQFVNWASFRRDVLGASITVTPSQDGTLLLGRFTVEADAATRTAAGVDESTAGYSTVAAQIPLVRFRAGEASQLGNGNTSTEFADNGLHNIINERTVDAYHYVKEAGTYSTGTAIISGYFMDIVDIYAASNAGAALPNGQVDYGLTLKKLEIFETPISADRSELSNATVIYNTGASTLSPIDGSGVHLSSDSLTPFDALTGTANFGGASEWWGRDNQEIAGKPANSRNVTVTGTASALSAAISAGDGSYHAVWDTVNYAINNTAEVAVVDNNKLVEIAVWYSSPQGSTTDNNLPGISGGLIRIGYQSDRYGGAAVDAIDSTLRVHGRAGYFSFNASNRTLQDVGYDMGTPYAAATSPQMVSMFFAPNLVEAAASQLHFRPALEAWSFPLNLRTATGFTTPPANDAFTAGTITWHRVIIRTYDLPVPPATASCDNP